MQADGAIDMHGIALVKNDGWLLEVPVPSEAKEERPSVMAGIAAFCVVSLFASVFGAALVRFLWICMKFGWTFAGLVP